MRRLLLIALLPALAGAQQIFGGIVPFPGFSQSSVELATNADGSVLYFSAPFRAKGSSQQFNSKIFRWTPSVGVELAAEDASQNLHLPQVSLDAATYGYTAGGPAYYGGQFAGVYYAAPGVLPTESMHATFIQSGRTLQVVGTGTLSPSGRYAITTPRLSVVSELHNLYDLTNGTSAVLAEPFDDHPQHVTDDGTIATAWTFAVVLTDRTGYTSVVGTENSVEAIAIDRTGSQLCYTGLESTALSLISVKTGLETPLTTGTSIADPRFSSDGSTIFFADEVSTRGEAIAQLFSIRTDGTGRRQLTNSTESIRDFTVSGDGKVAFVLGSAVRRVDLVSGTTTNIVPPSPILLGISRVRSLAFFSRSTALGSLVEFSGYNLDALKQINFCGRDLPLRTTEHGWGLLVPFDTPLGDCRILATSDAPYESAISTTVVSTDPQFSAIYDSKLSRPITKAHPGDIVVAYMTGLGPADASGLVGGMQCGIGGVAVEILYAGVAPYIPGFYQLNLRIPQAPSDSNSLFCGFDANNGASTPFTVLYP